MTTPSSLTTRAALLVYGGLLALLIASAALANGSWSGGTKGALCLGIAAVQVTLSFWFFMHLKYSRGLIRLFAACGFLWLAIIGLLTFSDYLTR